jgi:hypothetical protein
VQRVQGFVVVGSAEGKGNSNKEAGALEVEG